MTSRVHAIRAHAAGGPEVLRWDEVELAAPGPGEARVRHAAIGLNYIDVYFRTGLYPPPAHPFVPGFEGAGIVETVGEGVSAVTPGDRVAYAARPLGAYAEARLIPAERLVKLPDAIELETAAGVMLKGLSAWYLLRRVFPVRKGTRILVHAAAGGVGQLVCQWARHLGALVIGTVGSDAKAEIAARAGCEHPIVYTREDFAARVKQITAGAGVEVAYDSVGAATFQRSLDCLAPLGTMVSFGQSSGPVPPVPLGDLASRGSLFLTRPSLFDYVARRADLEAGARELFDLVARGVVEARIEQRFPLREAAAAHAALEGRRTTGATVLVP